MSGAIRNSTTFDEQGRLVKLWSLILMTPFLAACSMFGKPASSVDPPVTAAAPPAAQRTLPLTERQRSWWAEHRHLARHVPGQGWQVTGYPGFYTDQGARIVPPEAEVKQVAYVEPKSENEATTSATEDLINRGKSLVGQGPDETLARRMLAEGQALYNQRQFAQAEEKFLEAADRWPDSPLAEDAMFLAGECQFFTDRYPDARRQYEGLLAKYTNSRYLDTAVQRLFSIGQYWEKVQAEDPHSFFKPNFSDDTRPRANAADTATDVYRKVYLNHPTGPLADDAIMAIGNINFRARRWEKADYHYNLLRNEYPTSSHQYEAHLLGLQAKFNMYQGPLYEQEGLVESKKIADRLLTQFPRQLADGNERARVEKLRTEVQAQRALREWEVAQYYQKNGHLRAAKLYYGNIIDEFPQSQFAQKARQEIVALGGQPEIPPPRFAWLTDLFDDDRTR